ncbi:hypothetical protein Nepgr_009847 [Nepenthes gracilis]|uniref:DNA-directed RNA polymerase n=1 Tax=Nepenthes gracilis TaxID=150966 RepID=A0AAD3XKI6_NEPGR|nr:hypothetical protein Nepgr_009847 [Nepenthes gracilis]
MGADAKEVLGTSKNGKFSWNGSNMEIDSSDSDDEFMDFTNLNELGETFLRSFCKKASSAFFRQYGLISHQINSYNDFVKSGIQKVFDSIGEINVEPGYDPSKKGDGEWKHACIRFGEVTLQRPKFWTGEKFHADGGEQSLNLLPRHARLQNMTYSARMKVKTHLQVYTQKMVRSDKFKTGKEQYLHKEIVSNTESDVLVGRIPVMVKSDLCWMSEAEKGDCDFDHGGYFIIKGAEKVFIAQEQVCLKRMWISKDPYWKVSYRENKRKRVLVKLVENPKAENIKGGEKVLSVYFLMIEVPIWILFFAIGVSTDKEIVDLIDCNIDDGRINNILIASIHDADEKCDGFRRENAALNYIDKLLKVANSLPGKPTREFINTNLFPKLSGTKQKARFLGYMVKCLLLAFSGRRKCDNRDDFRNKRLDLACELLERELWVHIKHAERRMVKAMQRDLYGDRVLHPIEHYLDASIVTNGLSRAFSTGQWSHHFKRSERINGVVANLRRTNPLQSTCDLRKTRQQVAYTGKVGDARYP